MSSQLTVKFNADKVNSKKREKLVQSLRHDGFCFIPVQDYKCIEDIEQFEKGLESIREAILTESADAKTRFDFNGPVQFLVDDSAESKMDKSFPKKDDLKAIVEESLKFLSDIELIDRTYKHVVEDEMQAISKLEESTYLRVMRKGSKGARKEVLNFTALHNDIEYYVNEQNFFGKQWTDIVLEAKKINFLLPFYNIVIFLHALNCPKTSKKASSTSTGKKNVSSASQKQPSHIFVKPGSHLSPELKTPNTALKLPSIKDFERIEVNGFSILIMNFFTQHFASNHQSAEPRISVDTRTFGLLPCTDRFYRSADEAALREGQINTFCKVLSVFETDLVKLTNGTDNALEDVKDQLGPEAPQALFLLSRVPIVRQWRLANNSDLFNAFGGETRKQQVEHQLANILGLLSREALRELARKSSLVDKVSRGLENAREFSDAMGFFQDCSQTLQALRNDFVRECFSKACKPTMIRAYSKELGFKPTSSTDSVIVKQFLDHLLRRLRTMVRESSLEEVFQYTEIWERLKDSHSDLSLKPFQASERGESDTYVLMHYIVYMDVLSGLYPHAVVTRDDDGNQDVRDVAVPLTLMQTMAESKFGLIVQNDYLSKISTTKIIELFTHVIYLFSDWFWIALDIEEARTPTLLRDCISFLRAVIHRCPECLDDVELFGEIIMAFRSMNLNALSDELLNIFIPTISKPLNGDKLDLNKAASELAQQQVGIWLHSQFTVLGALSPLESRKFRKPDWTSQAGGRLSNLLKAFPGAGKSSGNLPLNAGKSFRGALSRERRLSATRQVSSLGHVEIPAPKRVSVERALSVPLGVEPLAEPLDVSSDVQLDDRAEFSERSLLADDNATEERSSSDAFEEYDGTPDATLITLVDSTSELKSYASGERHLQDPETRRFAGLMLRMLEEQNRRIQQLQEWKEAHEVKCAEAFRSQSNKATSRRKSQQQLEEFKPSGSLNKLLGDIYFRNLFQEKVLCHANLKIHEDWGLDCLKRLLSEAHRDIPNHLLADREKFMIESERRVTAKECESELKELVGKVVEGRIPKKLLGAYFWEKMNKTLSKLKNDCKAKLKELKLRSDLSSEEVQEAVKRFRNPFLLQNGEGANWLVFCNSLLPTNRKVQWAETPYEDGGAKVPCFTFQAAALMELEKMHNLRNDPKVKRTLDQNPDLLKLARDLKANYEQFQSQESVEIAGRSVFQD